MTHLLMNQLLVIQSYIVKDENHQWERQLQGLFALIGLLDTKYVKRDN